MEQYFYFGEATVETTSESACFPLSAFLGLRPNSATTVVVYFKAVDNTLDADNVVVTHTGTSTKVMMSELASVFNTKARKPLLVVVDRLGSANAVDLTGLITSVTVNKS